MYIMEYKRTEFLGVFWGGDDAISKKNVVYYIGAAASTKVYIVPSKVFIDFV